MSILYGSPVDELAFEIEIPFADRQIGYETAIPIDVYPGAVDLKRRGRRRDIDENKGPVQGRKRIACGRVNDLYFPRPGRAGRQTGREQEKSGCDRESDMF